MVYARTRILAWKMSERRAAKSRFQFKAERLAPLYLINDENWWNKWLNCGALFCDVMETMSDLSGEKHLPRVAYASSWEKLRVKTPHKNLVV